MPPNNALAQANPQRNLLAAQMLPATGEGSYLRQQFPQVYGFLGGLAGTAPDEMQGSAMDPNTAAVRQGASYGYLPGLVASSAPLGKVGAGMGMLAGMARGTQKFDNSALMAKKFDVVKRDASEIFGAGAERLRYTDPASGGMIDVLKRPDNTASVLGLEVPEAFRGKGIGESLQSQVLQDFPAMMGQVSSKAAAKTAFRLGRRPPNQPDATLDDVFKLMDENSSVNLVSPKMQQTFNPAPSSTFDNTALTGAKFTAPQDEALRLAQQRATLPPAQGGLGLPAGNTPEQRAAAMGFNTDAYHGTNISNITKFDLGKSSRGEGTSVALTPENAQAYGNITYPLKVNQQKIFDPTNKDQFNELKSYVENLIQKQKPYDKDSLSFYPFTSKKVLENLANPQTGSYYLENELISKSLQDLGYLGSIGMESGQSQLKMFEPENLRSRFAAFDPFRKTAAIAATMGVAAPDLLAGQAPQQAPQFNNSALMK